jgi:ribonuclease HI
MSRDHLVLADLAADLDPAATLKKHRLHAEELRAILLRAASALTPAPAAADAVFVVQVDGAARGNPGPAGAGILISRDGRVVEGIAQYLGASLTNNQAEYNALIIGLTRVQELGAEKVEVRSDSELMVRQMRGQYRVKNQALAGLFERARRLATGFRSFDIVHVRRELNGDADRLANRALDEFSGPEADEEE